jgi:glycerol-3-phosphate dehydrogenase subunit B
MSPSLQYDAVVVGAGVAGLTAGARLAQEGARVCVLAKGVGSTHLAPGTIDVLGYDPERVDEPGSALPAFVAARPEHPYATIGVDAIGPALEWFAAQIEQGPQPDYTYRGSLDHNYLLPTAVGVPRPSALVPETMAAGDLGDDSPVCVVGIRALRDFHAALCAANLKRAGVDARPAVIHMDVGRTEVNALGLARSFDQESFRAAFAARLAPMLGARDRIALPATLGIRDPHRVWSDLERRLERSVFEIPTLPPSAPGIRVYDALRAALRAAGGRLVLGAEVMEAERDGARVAAVRSRASGHDTLYTARWFVLATGGFASGGIELGDDWRARETVMGLGLRGMPAPDAALFDPNYFADQPISRAGIAVDSSLRAEDTENVFVAGAALPGAEPWREGSGEGIALASGHSVAGAVLEREGTKAAA